MCDRTAFQQKCQNNWTPIGKVMNRDLNLTSYIKINSKMDHGLKYKTFREKKNFLSIGNLWLGKEFLYWIPKA